MIKLDSLNRFENKETHHETDEDVKEPLLEVFKPDDFAYKEIKTTQLTS